MNLRKLISLSTFVLTNCVFTQASMATFSGTNGKIAFSSYKPSATSYSYLQVINPDGSGKETIYLNPSKGLTDGAVSPDHPSLGFPRWSPSGKKLAVAGYFSIPAPYYAATEVYTMNADGKRLVRITNTPGNRGGIQPTWSPDGKKLAYYTYYDFGFTSTGGGINVATINADGSDNRKQTNEGFGLFDHIDWANNGKIFFGADPSTSSRSVISIEPKFGAPAPFTPAKIVLGGKFSDYSGSPSVSPDNKQILYRNISSSTEPTGIYLSKIDGTNRTLVTTDAISEAIWSPDGKKVAYLKDNDIYVASIVDGALTRDINITNTPDIKESQIDWGPAAS